MTRGFHNYVAAEAHGSKVVAEGGCAQNPPIGPTLQLHVVVGEYLVPPTRIERATRGLGICNRGIAQVLERAGQSLVFLALRWKSAVPAIHFHFTRSHSLYFTG